MEQQREVTAKTVEEAVELALKELDVTREEVEVEVLSRGRAGFLGIGAEPARVRVRRLAALSAAAPSLGGPPLSEATPAASAATAAQAVDVVTKLMATAGAQVKVSLRTPNDPDTGGPIVDIEGEDSGLLIGRRGETLQAVQLLVNLMVNRQNPAPVRVVLDVERYRERRQRALREMALKVAQRVVQTGRPITLEPMPPAERRVVHVALASHPQVTTQSVGAGLNRKVSIMPRRGGPSQTGQQTPPRERV